MSIVGNGPMFRDPTDFADDARLEREREPYRLWLQTPEGRAAVAAARARQERYQRGACLMSTRYRLTQAWINATLMGVDVPLPKEPDFGSAEEAILRDGPGYNEEQRWFSH